MPPTPKKIETISRGICIRENHILLCRNRDSAYWYLPGGHIEPGESAEQALHREFREETGARVKIGELVLVHEHLFTQGHKNRHEYSFYYLTTAPSRISSKEKHLEVKWVQVKEAARFDVRPKVMMNWVRMNVGVFLEEHPVGITFLTTRRSEEARLRR